MVFILPIHARESGQLAAHGTAMSACLPSDMADGQAVGRLASLTRPGVSLVCAADVLAGYVIAAPALPRPEETLAAVPLLFAGAFLLTVAGHVFSCCFSPAGALLAGPVAPGRVTLKAAFLLGALAAVGGLFATMGAALSTGRLPVYFAALLFLVTWARAGRGAELAVLGPVSAGAARALTLAVGMSAHSEVVYLVSPGPPLAAGLFFVYGALAEAVRQTEREGGRRYVLLAASLGFLAVFVISASALARTEMAWIMMFTGAILLAARAWPAVRSLTPADVRRFTQVAFLAGCILDAGLCFGRWPAEGAVLALGASALLLVLPGIAIMARVVADVTSV